MPTVMDKKRIGIFMDKEVHAALKAEASERGVDMSELAEDILRAALAETIERVRRKRQAEAKRRGRQED